MPGPGYPSPLEAMKGPKEQLLYVVCIQPDVTKGNDLLATVDVDPASPTYCQIIHRLHTEHAGDEIHHSGWNICSSCYKEPCCPKRNKLILPCLGSSRIYVVDTESDPRAPKMHKKIDNTEVFAQDCSTLHTSHCLPSGEIMISTLGNKDGEGKGDFLLLDANNFKVKGTWTAGRKLARFGYDFWYQPYWDTMVASEWAAPKLFKRGFEPSDVDLATKDVYGHALNFYAWEKRELVQTIDFWTEGIAPLEVRFLHDPKASQGFVGCAVSSNIYRFYRKDDGIWAAEKVIQVAPKKVSGWVGGDYLQGMITDILLSLDDKYLYFSNWLHGDVRQYDISNPKEPKLTGQVFLGGQILSDSKIKVLEDPELKKQPDPVFIKDRRLYGAPQMLQLSLDGKRLYVSSSLFSPWDKEFYPDSVKHGSTIVKLDIDVEKGGMKLDEKFLVDFGLGPDGPLLAHEMRYPGGDCTSDIWLA